ncbi:MAG: hypothetical protein NZM31_13930 [Gemmatales bacterium]|nr:hypothetical protein [Gemmatales bacterium]MDW8388095.1 hypothetical protein [Gemmatales bacterium]
MTWTVSLVSLLALASGLLPLIGAASALKRTPLFPTTLWLLASWASAMVSGICSLIGSPALPWLYGSLALTACAFVSVLGARRPGVGAWNFVTLGLLAVLSLPFLEQPWDSPHWVADTPWAVLLGGVLTVGVVNYVPTRWCWAALGLALGFAVALVGLNDPELAMLRSPACLHLLLAWFALGSWIAWWLLSLRVKGSDPCSLIWLRFRDAYGLMWAKRVQEQFNVAASHAGLTARLNWHGLDWPKAASENAIPRQKEEEQLCQLLLAVLKRFGVQDEASK